MPPFIRPFLTVAQTTLQHPETGEQYEFHGLYTGVNIPKGSFLGFYNGRFKDGEYRGRNSYVFSLSEMYIHPSKTKGYVDPMRYPLAMCNEPPNGTVANVCAVEFSKAKNVIPQLPSSASISALAFYTCRDVKGGEELFIHYGEAYHRGHYVNYDTVADPLTLVGKPCTVLKRDREMPMDMMRHFGLLYVDSECFVEMEYNRVA